MHMTAEEILFEAEMTMEKSVDYMVHEFAAVRTGKASPALVENVDVRGLRLGHETEAARADHDAGAATAGRPAVRCQHRAGYREGAEGIEDRNHARGGWKNHPACRFPNFRKSVARIWCKSLSKMAEEARVRVRGQSAHRDGRSQEIARRRRG